MRVSKGVMPVVPYADDISGVYIIAGQSNALGLGLISDASANLQGTIPGAKIWNPSTPAWETLSAGVNNDGSSNIRMGSEMKFAYDMVAKGASPYIIKNGISSKDLAVDFYPGTGTEYIGMMARIDAAMTAYYALGQRREIRAVIWSQGENDARDQTKANAYQANLELLIDTMRSTFYSKGYAGPRTRFVITSCYRTAPTDAYESTVRAAEQAVTQTRPACDYIDTTSFTMLADGIHYDGAGQVLMGTAEAARFP